MPINNNIKSFLAVAILCSATFGFAETLSPATAPQTSPAEKITERIDSDLSFLLNLRLGLVSLINFVHENPQLFAQRQPAVPVLEEREEIGQVWKSFLDYIIALDLLGQNYRHYYRLKGENRTKTFLLFRLAFLTKYRYGMEWIKSVENNPDLDTILNEPLPQLGLPKNTYAKLKFRFLNIAKAAEFSALESVTGLFSGDECPEVREASEEDAAFIWKMGWGKGELLTITNGLNIIQKTGFSAWFPIQAGVAEWMGNTKVHRVDTALISTEQIAQILPKLEPGDILLERREWYLTNVGIPGFWTHGALYVGSPKEREAYFNDQQTSNWVIENGQEEGNFETLLSARYPQAYKMSLVGKDNNQYRLLEAISEGVVFTSLEESAHADSIVVLRPRLTKKEKASAIYRAFQYQGRPYDYTFDFLTDSALVCTELLFKAYEPNTDSPGIKFPLQKVVGRKLLPANEIAHLFSNEYGKGSQQFDFVLFLDGDEKSGCAVDKKIESFLNSWQRPKWHVLVQEKTKR